MSELVPQRQSIYFGLATRENITIKINLSRCIIQQNESCLFALSVRHQPIRMTANMGNIH
ncbi:hypothetical protein D3C85_1942890 [compost metagenome]